MKLSVVVPTHQRHQRLLKMIDAVRKQNIQFHDFELIVVSNLEDSFFKGEAFRQISKDLNLHLLTVGKVGVNRARNLGVSEACGDVILLLDDDCVPANPSLFEDHCFFHQKFPKAIAIGGSYSTPSDASTVAKAYNILAKAWQEPSLVGDLRSSRLVGGHVSYKRELLEDSGEKFDEGILFGGTESEFHQRLNRLGFETLFLNYLDVEHHNEMEASDLVRRAYAQATTQAHFDVDRGQSWRHGCGYHGGDCVLAFEEASSEEEFQELMTFMELYNWSYQMTLVSRGMTERNLQKKASRWLRKSDRTTSEVFV